MVLQTDDEKFFWKDMSLEKAYRLAYENAKVRFLIWACSVVWPPMIIKNIPHRLKPHETNLLSQSE